MTTPNFFTDVDALKCLLQMDSDDPSKDIDLTLDFIDLPIWFSFRSDEKTQTLKVFTQTELYVKDETLAMEQGSMVLDRASGQASVKAEEQISKHMGVFFTACQKLRCLIQEKGLESLYADLDPDKAGILLKENDGELCWKVVSGRERPNLTLVTMFGEITTGRPYMEDFWERSELHDIGLEEKTAAAEEGNTTAMEELALLYLNGNEEQKVEPDSEKAVYWFTKLAETGDSNAMFNLGLHYAKGHGVNRDFVKAAEWMDKAAEAGDDDAPKLSMEYRKLASAVGKASSGDAQAQADLAKGLMGLGGSLDQAGAGDDYVESVKWAKLAAEQGNADAMWVLALAYEHGRGVDEDVDSALKYYEQGAELGNAACQHSLGCYYLSGENLKNDNKKAFDLFQRSAAQGYGLAMKDLGRCYQFGHGCTGNMKTALEWYKKASEVLDDPELDQRVMLFQSLADNDPTWGEDYPGEDDMDEINGTRTTAIYTYSENLQGRGPGYRMDIPDGFLFANMTEDRDFIAYDPNYEDARNYEESDFVIMAGKRLEGENFKSMRTKEEFIAVARSAGSLVVDALELSGDVTVVPIERDDAPGAIVYWLDDQIMHVNAFVGINDHMQGFRFQINGVSEYNKNRYESSIKELMEGVTVEAPVKLLKSLDADEFLRMVPDDAESKEWGDLINEYIMHLSVARGIEQSVLVKKAELQANNSLAGLLGMIASGEDGTYSANDPMRGLMSGLKSMLSNYSKRFEELLLDAEIVYTMKLKEYPGNAGLAGMKTALVKLAESADQSVSVDGEKLEVKSRIAADVLSRIPLTAAEIAEKKEKEDKIEREKHAEERKKAEAANARINKRQKMQDDAVSYVAEFKSVIDGKAAEMEEKLLANNNREIEEHLNKIKEAEYDLSKLGAFMFSEKSALKSDIRSRKEKISKLQDPKTTEALREKVSGVIEQAKKDYEMKVQDFISAFIKYDDAYPDIEKRVNERLRMIEALCKADPPTVQEVFNLLVKTDPSISGSKVSSYLNQMKNEGILSREGTGRDAEYYPNGRYDHDSAMLRELKSRGLVDKDAKSLGSIFAAVPKAPSVDAILKKHFKEYAAAEAMDAFLNKIDNAKPGSAITFGHYPQDSETAEPITWTVLDKDEDSLLLYSKRVLDAKPFNSKSSPWRFADIRNWLNYSFYIEAFDNWERDLIKETSIVTNGTTTKDHVFLLSKAESEAYNVRSFSPSSFATPYAKKKCYTIAWLWNRDTNNMRADAAAGICPALRVKIKE